MQNEVSDDLLRRQLTRGNKAQFPHKSDCLLQLAVVVCMFVCLKKLKNKAWFLYTQGKMSFPQDPIN